MNENEEEENCNLISLPQDPKQYVSQVITGSDEIEMLSVVHKRVSRESSAEHGLSTEQGTQTPKRSMRKLYFILT